MRASETCIATFQKTDTHGLIEASNRSNVWDCGGLIENFVKRFCSNRRIHTEHTRKTTNRQREEAEKIYKKRAEKKEV